MRFPALVDEQLLVQCWHSQFFSLLIDFLTARLLHLIVPDVVSTLLEIVEILRIDLKHYDNVEVHFLTGTLPLLGECLAVSSLLLLHESAESVAELRVPELTRK